MHLKPSRRAEASRAVYMAAMNCTSTPVLNYVEAIACEPYSDRDAVAAAVDRAIDALSTSTDVLGDAGAIAAAFFSGDLPSAPTPPTKAPAKREFDPKGPAKYPVPGEWDHDVEMPVQRRKSAAADDGRSLLEMQYAGLVLCGAVRRRRELQDFGFNTSIRIFKTVTKLRNGKRDTEANDLATVAEGLRMAATAAGVDARQTRATTPDDLKMQRFVAAGAGTAEIECMRAAAAEFDTLIVSGAPLRVSRDNYIKHALQRLKAGR